MIQVIVVIIHNVINFNFERTNTEASYGSGYNTEYGGGGPSVTGGRDSYGRLHRNSHPGNRGRGGVRNNDNNTMNMNEDVRINTHNTYSSGANTRTESQLYRVKSQSCSTTPIFRKESSIISKEELMDRASALDKQLNFERVEREQLDYFVIVLLVVLCVDYVQR